MTKPAAIQHLEDARQEIVWWEICSILHDVGKLSGRFHEYRQKWWNMPGGYRNHDPHEHDWLDDDRLLTPELRAFFEKALVSPTKVAGTLSVQAAVHEHRERSDSALVELLRAGDRADSRYDRNNPLLSNEQTDWSGGVREAFRGNVYGYETGRAVTGASLHAERKKLYEALEKVLPMSGPTTLDWTRYRKITDKIEEHFERGMSDTTRPGNDTSLHEHVYAVASITKALHAEAAVSKAMGNADTPAERWMPFALYGIGVDTWAWCAQGHRIGDVTSRKEEIDTAFTRVRQTIEFDCPMGNRVYADDNFHIYLVGRVEGLETDVREWLDDRVQQIFREETSGDLTGCTTLIARTLTTTKIVEVIDNLRKQTGTPSNWVAAPAAVENEGRSDLCPVCRRQGAPDRRTCGDCLKRRNGIEWPGEETPFLSEIADSKGRVALVVARFGLRDWLSGQMTRSCLVTEPAGIARMGEVLKDVEELKGEAPEFGEWLKKNDVNTYHGMLAQLRRIRSAKTDDLGVSLFARNPDAGQDGIRLNRGFANAEDIWREDLTHAGEDYWGGFDENEKLLSLICGKTPTPSSTLDAWMTTKEFFEQAPGWARELIGTRARGWIRVDAVPGWLMEKSTVRGRFPDGKVSGEYLHHQGQLWGIDPGAFLPKEGTRLTVKGDSGDEASVVVTERSVDAREYRPWRTLTASPDVLMMLVPADRAAELTRIIAEQYGAHFGKVKGRLPLAVGNIFFPQHQPMFAVLDAAWRMIGNFRRLQEGPWVKRRFEGAAAMPLGDGSRDNFHNHAVCAERPAVASAMLTPAGWIAHRADIAEGTEILERLNVYDGVVLGVQRLV